MRTQAGFTLIELVVTLVIAAILAAVAMPAMSTMLVSNRIRTGSTDLMSALLLARSEAIKRNGQVAVQPAVPGDWSKGWIVEAVGSGEQYDRRTALGPDVQVSGGPDEIVYDRNGRLTAFGLAKLQLDDAQGRITPRCLAIDLSGMPRISYGACG
jgi:type IV fimbrial biogenesis protein FimT